MSAHTVILIFCLSHMCAENGGGGRVRGGDGENIIGTEREREREREREQAIDQIPGETDKAVSFIEDIVYVAVYCNAMLTFPPIPGSPQGRVRPAGGSV